MCVWQITVHDQEKCVLPGVAQAVAASVASLGFYVADVAQSNVNVEENKLRIFTCFPKAASSSYN